MFTACGRLTVWATVYASLNLLRKFTNTFCVGLNVNAVSAL